MTFIKKMALHASKELKKATDEWMWRKEIKYFFFKEQKWRKKNVKWALVSY